MIGGITKFGGRSRDAHALIAHLAKTQPGGSSFEAMNTAASTMAAVVSEARLAAAARGIGARPFWHIHLSPSAAMDEAGLRKAVAVVCREMGVTDHPIGVEYHSKPRRHGGAEIHAHLVIGRAAWSGNLLASGFEKIRLEGACRVAEFEAGDQHVLGRHHASTVRRLTKVGRLDVIESLRRVHGDNPPKPRGSLSPEKRQKLARLGVDGAAARAAVKLAWDISDDGRSFGQALIDNGFAIKHGDKPGIWIVTEGDIEIGSVDRIVGQKRQAVAFRLRGWTPEEKLDSRKILTNTRKIGAFSQEARRDLIAIRGSLEALTQDNGENTSNPVIELLEVLTQVCLAQSERLTKIEISLDRIERVVTEPSRR